MVKVVVIMLVMTIMIAMIVEIPIIYRGMSREADEVEYDMTLISYDMTLISYDTLYGVIDSNLSTCHTLILV